MDVFLTGGTGFIGGEVARRLRARGDRVRALVRTPAKATWLATEGCELVEGDLANVAAIEGGVVGADALVHVAASYEIGVPASRHADIYDTNVDGTERVMRAALGAGVERVVYVSTCAAFGNTHRRIVDESYRHDGDYRSYYEETKTLAHRLVERMIAEDGLPAVIVQPGAVYGPGDTSELGGVVKRFLAGKLPAMALGDAGFTFVHRDDVADGIVRALDKGRVGESYVLGGEIATTGEVIDMLARIAGRKPPRFRVPTVFLKAFAPLGPLVAPMLGFPPNLKELISAADRVTYWATHEKAARELGYTPRRLEQGLREYLVAEGLIA